MSATLGEIVDGGRISHRRHLVQLKNHLTAHIHFDPQKKHLPRPLLRHSASHILQNGQGFCGENARVAILLLRKAGIRANRLYLEGRRWGHVAVEHEWAGGFYLFDAHNDPATLLADADVARIPSDDLGAFPNAHPQNPWQRVYRIKLFDKLPGLRRFSHRRPPACVIQVTESPHLMKAISLFVLGALGAATTFWAA